MIEEGPKYSLPKSKTSFIQKSPTDKLGPGEYNLRLPNHIKNTKIGNEKREFSIHEEEGPGPGLYNLFVPRKDGM